MGPRTKPYPELERQYKAGQGREVGDLSGAQKSYFLSKSVSMSDRADNGSS